ncbi:MAG: hypothetical protein ABIK22_01270 [candidate division WOR-3 bacterium]
MRHCCIRAKNPGRVWYEVRLPAEIPTATVPADFSLAGLLQQTPEFIGPALGNWTPRALTVMPSATSARVFVAVDEAGRIAIVGCPDQQIEGGVSAMAGDLLAATGRLWHQPFRTLAAMFGDPEGVKLAEQLRERSGAFDPARFQAGVDKSLEEGKFPMVIAVDRIDETIEKMMEYLSTMNLRVRLMSYDYLEIDGLEIVLPRVLGEEEPEPPAEKPVSTPYLEYTPTVTAIGQEEPQPRKVYEPFPVEGTTPKQQAILERLVYIDDLGLVRRGFEYFTPKNIQRAVREGTVVVAVDPSRWPFPKPDEVVVVVRTGLEHLAGFLKMKQQEVEDFLKLLPRDEKKEHKGVVLLYARNVYEANQLVNELKALKEVSQTGVR